LDKIFSITLVLLTFLATPSWSASYDCSKASTQVEHLICNDGELSKLDEELVFNYAQTMEQGEYKSYLKNSQRFWIKNIRDVCTDTACLKMMYKERINLPIWFVSETPCNKEDRYENDGYKFGALIKDILRTKNTEGLFSEGSFGGPRKRFLISKSFDGVFQREWVEGILEDETCGPLGWRGFMLSNGMIYYDRLGDKRWVIKALNGTKEEEFIAPKGWYVDEKLLSHRCFADPKYWYQEFNYLEEVAKDFKISDSADFASNPGKYFGAEIDYKKGEKEALIVRVEDCLAPLNTMIEEPGSVVEYISDHSRPLAHYYRLIRTYNSAPCQLLAPNIQSPCLEAFYVLAGQDSGGTIGHFVYFGIYGLFDLEKMGLSIIPLKWTGQNEGLDFIDDTNF
jgi:uncharacterized protein YecT (DUF1311 family)